MQSALTAEKSLPAIIRRELILACYFAAANCFGSLKVQTEPP